MRITLARLPGFGKIKDVSPPLGIASLAGYILGSELSSVIDIHLLDMLPLNIDESECIEMLLATRPEIIGLSYLTVQAEEAKSILTNLKSIKGRPIVIVGGNHPSVVSQEPQEAGADAVVVGEGEKQLLEILKNILKKQPIHKASETRNRLELLPANKIPTPAWELIDLSIGYNETAHFDEKPCMPVITSRGCYGSCTFCGSNSMWFRKVRYRPIKDVITEITNIHTSLGYNRIHFYDDDFLANKQHAIRLCTILINQLPKIKWTCLATVRSIVQNKEILPMLYKAGCRGLEFGFESADPKVLLCIGKRQDLDQVEEAIELLRTAQISYIDPLSMLFNEGETPDSLKMELDFFRKVGFQIQPISNHQFATPYPGTLFSFRANNIGKLFSTNWSEYRSDHVTFIPHSFLDSKPVGVVKTDGWQEYATNCLDWTSAIGIERYHIMNLASLYNIHATSAIDISHLGRILSERSGVELSITIRASAIFSLLAIYYAQ